MAGKYGKVCGPHTAVVFKPQPIFGRLMSPTNTRVSREQLQAQLQSIKRLFKQ